MYCKLRCKNCFIYSKWKIIRVSIKLSSLDTQSIEISTLGGVYSVGAQQSTLQNVQQSGFSCPLKSDSFESSSVKAARHSLLGAYDDFLAVCAPRMLASKYLNEDYLKKALGKNPKISDILYANGIVPKVEVSNVNGKNISHFMETYDRAKELGAYLNTDDYRALLEAALLHDIGKAFIPSEILNKPGALTAEERKIVDLHSQIGAEVLKTSNINPKAIEAVRLHHLEYNNAQKQGNEIAQILSVADVYSALSDERPYKRKFSPEEIKYVMQTDPKLNQAIVKDIFSPALAA